MIASLAAAALCIGFATASPRPSSNTTETHVFTVVPAIPVIASPESSLEVPHHTDDFTSTYVPVQTPSGISDDDTPSGSYLSSTSSLDRIVHVEETRDSLAAPTTTPPPVAPPSPIALTSHTTVEHPTYKLPTVSGSPIALTSDPSAVGPTLPPSVYSSPVALTTRTTVAGPTYPTSILPAVSALTTYPSVAGPTLPVSEGQDQTTHPPETVHTEIPAESLAVPRTRTSSVSDQQTARPPVPVPGADNRPDSQPVPSSTKTFIPEQITTMSGGEVVTVHRTPLPAESAPPSSSTTLQTSATSSSAPSETDRPAGNGQGSGNEEQGAAGRLDVVVCLFLMMMTSMAVSAVTLL